MVCVPLVSGGNAQEYRECPLKWCKNRPTDSSSMINKNGILAGTGVQIRTGRLYDMELIPAAGRNGSAHEYMSKMISAAQVFTHLTAICMQFACKRPSTKMFPGCLRKGCAKEATKVWSDLVMALDGH